MSTSEILRGTIKPDGTLELDQRSNLPAGPVEIVLRPLSSTTPGDEDWWQYLQRVRADAESAGEPFRSSDEIEQEREDFRSGDQRIEHVYDEMDQRRRKSSG